MQGINNIKNIIGDFKGYARCPITGNTYWHEKLISINFSAEQKYLFSEKALKTSSIEEIAKVALEKGKENNLFNEKLYTLEEITKKISDKYLKK